MQLALLQELALQQGLCAGSEPFQTLHLCDMRFWNSPISSRQKLIGGLLASAVLAFVVAFAKVSKQSCTALLAVSFRR